MMDDDKKVRMPKQSHEGAPINLTIALSEGRNTRTQANAEVVKKTRSLPLKGSEKEGISLMSHIRSHAPKEGKKCLYKLKLPIDSNIRACKEVRTNNKTLKIKKKSTNFKSGKQREMVTEVESVGYFGEEDDQRFDNKGEDSSVSKEAQLFYEEQKEVVLSEHNLLSEVGDPNLFQWLDTLNIAKKVKKIQDYSIEHRNVFELKLNAYIAACHSLKTLVPFPWFVTSRDETGRRELQLLNSDFLEVGDVIKVLTQPICLHHHEAIVNIMYWLFICIRNPILQNLPSTDFWKIMRRVGYQSFTGVEPMVFKVLWHIQSPIEAEWACMKTLGETKYSFFSCPLSQLHSVLHYGLYPNLMKKGLYGCGFYLTDDLNTAIKMGQDNLCTDRKSPLNSKKVVLVVEYVSNPNLSLDTKFSMNEIFQGEREEGDVRVNWHFLLLTKSLRVRYVLFFSKILHSLLPHQIKQDVALNKPRVFAAMAVVISSVFVISKLTSALSGTTHQNNTPAIKSH